MAKFLRRMLRPKIPLLVQVVPIVALVLLWAMPVYINLLMTWLITSLRPVRPKHGRTQCMLLLCSLGMPVLMMSGQPVIIG